MYRLATLLAFLTLLLAGCEGDSGGDEDGSASTSPGGAQAERESAGAEKPAASAGSAKKKADEEDTEQETSDDRASAEAPTSAEEAADALEDLPLSEKRPLIKTIVSSVLLQFGLEVTDVEVRDNGRKVLALISRETACRAVASHESSMAGKIRQGAPSVKSVRLEVAGTGEELGYYVLRCKKPAIPDGPGRLVLRHTGVGGPWTSKAFEIESDRWALEYENQGNSLAVIVKPLGASEEEEYVEPVGSQKPEAGRKVYKRGGRFELKVYGAGQWTVRVKEMR